MLHWKTSVSDHCCLAFTNTTYKADAVIETIELDDDKCKSTETQVCRKLPGMVLHFYGDKNLIVKKPFLQDKKRQRLNQSLIIKLVVITTELQGDPKSVRWSGTNIMWSPPSWRGPGPSIRS